jgi:hypothetical protein
MVSPDTVKKVQSEIREEIIKLPESRLEDDRLIHYGKKLSTGGQRIRVWFRSIWHRIKKGKEYSDKQVQDFYQARTFKAIKQLNKETISTALKINANVNKEEIKALFKVQKIERNQIVLESSPILKKMTFLHKFYLLKEVVKTDTTHWLNHSTQNDLGAELRVIDPFLKTDEVNENPEAFKRIIQLDEWKEDNKDQISRDAFLSLLNFANQENSLKGISDNSITDFQNYVELYKKVPALETDQRPKRAEQLFHMIQDLKEKRGIEASDKIDELIAIYNTLPPREDQRFEKAQKQFLIIQDLKSNPDFNDDTVNQFNAFLADEKNALIKSHLIRVFPLEVSEETLSLDLIDIQKLSQQEGFKIPVNNIALCGTIQDIKAALQTAQSQSNEVTDIAKEFGQPFAEHFSTLSSEEGKALLTDLRKLRNDFVICEQESLFEKVIKKIIEKKAKATDLKKIVGADRKTKAIPKVSKILETYIQSGLTLDQLKDLRFELLRLKGVFLPDSTTSSPNQTENKSSKKTSENRSSKKTNQTKVSLLKSTLSRQIEKTVSRASQTATRVKNTLKREGSFETQSSKVLANFHIGQFTEAFGQWRERYGEVLALYLKEALGSDVINGTIYYKDKGNSPYSKLDEKLKELDQAHDQFKAAGLLNEFHALVDFFISEKPKSLGELSTRLEAISVRIAAIKDERHLSKLAKLNKRFTQVDLSAVYNKQFTSMLKGIDFNQSEELEQEIDSLERTADLLEKVPESYRKAIGEHLMNHLLSKIGKEKLKDISSLKEELTRLNEIVQHFTNEIPTVTNGSIQVADFLKSFVKEQSQTESWFLLNKESILSFSQKVYTELNELIIKNLENSHGPEFSSFVRQYIKNNADLSLGKAYLKQSPLFETADFTQQIKILMPDILSQLKGTEKPLKGTEKPSILDDDMIEKSILSNGLAPQNLGIRLNNLKILQGLRYKNKTYEIEKELIRYLNSNPSYLLDIDVDHQNMSTKELERLQKIFKNITIFCFKDVKKGAYQPVELAQGIQKLLEKKIKSNNLQGKSPIEVLATVAEELSKTFNKSIKNEFLQICAEIRAEKSQPLNMQTILETLDKNAFSLIENFVLYFVENLLPEKNTLQVETLRDALQKVKEPFNSSPQIKDLLTRTAHGLTAASGKASNVDDIKGILAKQISSFKNFDLEEELIAKFKEELKVENLPKEQQLTEILSRLNKLPSDYVTVKIGEIFQKNEINYWLMGLNKIREEMINCHAAVLFSDKSFDELQKNDLIINVLYNIIPNQILKHKDLIIGGTQGWGPSLIKSLQVLPGMKKLTVKIGGKKLRDTIRPELDKIQSINPDTREVILSTLEPLLTLLILALPDFLKKHQVSKYIASLEDITTLLETKKLEHLEQKEKNGIESFSNSLFSNEEKIKLLMALTQLTQLLIHDLGQYVPLLKNAVEQTEQSVKLE